MYYISDSPIMGPLEDTASSPLVFKSHCPTMGFNISSPSCPSALADFIGSESCTDLRHEDDVQLQNVASLCRSVHHDHSKSEKYWGDDRIKEFPPPMPFLARTENLASHMPWVLRRNYTNDGRLVLTEEKVRHHEYFRAYRGDGRLTLQLIPLRDDTDEEDDNVLDNFGLEEDDEVFITNGKEDRDENNTVFNDVRMSKMKDELRLIGVDELVLHQSATLESETSVRMGSSGTPKCLNLNMASSPSSLFSLPVPAARTVST